MFISHDKKLVFIHIPKTAGTAVTCALRALLPEDVTTNHPLLTKHAKAHELVTAFTELGWNWDEYLKVTVMRHPHEIIHSDYWYHRYLAAKHHTAPPRDPEHPEYAWYFKCWESQYLPFTEYVLRAYGNWDKGFFANYIITPLGEACHVLQQATLDADWAQLCTQLELPVQPLPIVNTTHEIIGHARPHLDVDFTPGLRNWAQHCFADDFARFGYSS